MTDFTTAIAAPARTLSIRATLTLLTGYAFALTDSDILSYTLSEGATGGDILLGSALSAHGTLSLLSPDGAWKEGGAKLGSRTLMGASAEIEIGVMTSSGFVYESAGSFIVTGIEAPEGADVVTLSGYDALLHRFSPAFSDDLTYPCTLNSILHHIAAQADCVIAGTPLCNADVLISARPDWGEGCTLRQALSCVAGAMGCFVRLSRSGPVEIVPLQMESTRTLNAGSMFSLTLQDTRFSFNRLRVRPRNSDSHIDCVLDASLPYGADNTLTIDDNPLFRADSSELNTLVDHLCQALSGLSFTPFSLAHSGDPTIEIGTHMLIESLDGTQHPALVFSQRLSFAEGLTAHLACDMDSSGISLPRVITSSGKLSSAALTDGIIAARHIAAGAVDAEKISARAITADHIALGTITSESGVIGALSADSITAGKLSTDRLIVGGSEFSIVRALNQLANSLAQNNDSIDGGVLSDKSIDASKVTDDFGAGLELSSNAAVLLLAGKLDGTNSHMELTQDAINMVGGEINIATNDLQIRGLDDGGEIMSLDPEGLSAKRVVVTEAFSAPNVVMSHPVATAEWKGGIQKSLDALPKYLTQDTTLTVPAGTYVEDVAIKGFVGAGLTLQLSSGVNINGRVSISDCSRIGVEASTLGDAAIYPRSGGAYTIDINSCQYVLLDKLYISGYRGRASTSDGTDRGVQVFRSNVRMQNCCIEYTDNYAYYQELGTFFIHTVIGGSEGSDATTNANLGYSVRALNGAHGGMYLAVPLSVSGYSSSAATLLPVSVTPTAGGMEYVEPEYITQTFTLSKHCTYLYGVKRIRDDQATTFSQGYYGTYASGNNNWRIGAMWFADAASALSGKTIKSAKLTMRRASGGWSNAVPVYLGTVALAESDFTSTLTPTFNKAATYPVGNLARETEATYDVTALMSAIQAGQAIGVFEPRSEFSGNFSPAYTNFYGLGSGYEPVLTVEYK